MIKFFSKYWKFLLIPFLVVIALVGCNTVKIINQNRQQYTTTDSGRELRQFTYYGTYSVPVENE